MPTVGLLAWLPFGNAAKVDERRCDFADGMADPNPMGADMNLPEIARRRCLQLRRRRTGYTAVRITKATRALLTKIESQFDEPLDSIIFYMAAKELGLNYVAILSVIDAACGPRRIYAPSAR